MYKIVSVFAGINLFLCNVIRGDIALYSDPTFEAN